MIDEILDLIIERSDIHGDKIHKGYSITFMNFYIREVIDSLNIKTHKKLEEFVR